MRFTYKKWEMFCAALALRNRKSITAENILEHIQEEQYIVLKHDVETKVKKAYKMAVIEQKYGHRGSYYVQAYLLNDQKNIKLLQQMKRMGHEISYHHDVMDSNQGNTGHALQEFESNKNLFEKNGFQIKTVCQHGNPLVERKGYTSNRDFFRNSVIQNKYTDIADIMVDFPQKANTQYLYYSDTGRKFKRIFDPFTNDIVNSDDKNISFENLDELSRYMENDANHIISVHPHRWTRFSMVHVMKNAIFKMIKFIAKQLFRIKIFKKIMSRYYYLAKKI